jgi:hypothetical protein
MIIVAAVITSPFINPVGNIPVPIHIYSTRYQVFEDFLWLALLQWLNISRPAFHII